MLNLILSNYTPAPVHFFSFKNLLSPCLEMWLFNGIYLHNGHVKSFFFICLSRDFIICIYFLSTLNCIASLLFNVCTK